MQLYTPIRASLVTKINNIDTICALAKDFKDSIVGVTPEFLYSTNPEGCVFKCMPLGLETPSFIFSVNQLKTLSAKALLASSEERYFVNGLITTASYVDTINIGNYLIDETQNFVDRSGTNIIPCIRTGVYDQFFEYHYRFGAEFERFLMMMNSQMMMNNLITFDNFDQDPVFIDMLEKKKEWGTFRSHLYDPGSDIHYIVSYFKNMIPYKKKDKVSLSVTRMNKTDNDFGAVFTITRKNHVPIYIYCHYLNLLRDY